MRSMKDRTAQGKSSDIQSDMLSSQLKTNQAVAVSAHFFLNLHVGCSYCYPIIVI